MKTTGDQRLVKRINRSVLLRLLRARPGLSRARLASESGLTKSTVSMLARELLDEGWVAEASSTVASGLGRPSTPLYINARARALIGVEMAVECVRVVGVSLLGEVLHATEAALPNHQPEAVFATAAALALDVRAAFGARGLQLAGIGVGLPGAIDAETGVLRFAPNLGWRNLEVQPLMSAAFAAAGLPGVALQVQNEADVAALGEYEFSPGEDAGSLIFVHCDVGVGAGVVLNDGLFTGAHGMAGEIGHMVLEPGGALCSCGRRGCVETFIGSRALASPGAVEAAGPRLGVVLQNLWMAFDPRCIVVGGPVCESHPGLLTSARATLADYGRGAGLAPPEVRGARYGVLSAAVGAAALVLHQQLRPLHPSAALRPAPPSPPAHTTPARGPHVSRH
ncbi:MAG: ROK family transcriptional regulator [Proteobacteria bacterium]|nr:ROK family transcriptional regulator [Pseudomonadota bacterium]